MGCVNCKDSKEGVILPQSLKQSIISEDNANLVSRQQDSLLQTEQPDKSFPSEQKKVSSPTLLQPLRIEPVDIHVEIQDGSISEAPRSSEKKGSTEIRSTVSGIIGRRRALSVEEDEDAKKKSPVTEDIRLPAYKVRKSIVTARVKYGPPELIFERYRFTEEVLGTGISGTVRVAEDKISGRKYAIKSLNLTGVSARKAAMLHNEVEIYLKLDHPNIAKLIEVYEDPSQINLVMELCKGKELYDRLASRKRYREGDAAKVAQQMLEAINYCHQHHICHRDLKLENWVYVDDGEDSPLKLIDFGFSRIFNPVIPMTAMHGTVYYVSPEVMDGCYRETCDIWSIGVIVYMLLAGTPPFNGSFDYEILIKIKQAQYSFAAPVWNSVSEDAKSFISHLLVKEPDQRPSAQEALKHPWLKQAGSQESPEIDIKVLQAMRQFALGNIMKRAALGLVAFSLTTQEVQDLYVEFKKLDKDKTGTIRLQDLVSVLQDNLSISQPEAQRVFEKIDQTGDREVQYSEFLASTIQTKLVLNDSWIREAFNKFDANHDGQISVESLRAILGDNYNGTAVEDILSSCDRKGRGVLDYDDFFAALASQELPQQLEAKQKSKSFEAKQSLTEAVINMATAG